MSRIIFKLTVTRGGPGLFSNLLSHTVMQDYFLIHSRTRVSMIIFKLTVARGGPGLFSNSLSHAGVREYFLIVLHAGVQEYFRIDCVD